MSPWQLQKRNFFPATLIHKSYSNVITLVYAAESQIRGRINAMGVRWARNTFMECSLNTARVHIRLCFCTSVMHRYIDSELLFPPNNMCINCLTLVIHWVPSAGNNKGRIASSGVSLCAGFRPGHTAAGRTPCTVSFLRNIRRTENGENVDFVSILWHPLNPILNTAHSVLLHSWGRQICLPLFNN